MFDRAFSLLDVRTDDFYCRSALFQIHSNYAFECKYVSNGIKAIIIKLDRSRFNQDRVNRARRGVTIYNSDCQSIGLEKCVRSERNVSRAGLFCVTKTSIASVFLSFIIFFSSLTLPL